MFGLVRNRICTAFPQLKHVSGIVGFLTSDEKKAAQARIDVLKAALPDLRDKATAADTEAQHVRILRMGHAITAAAGRTAQATLAAYHDTQREINELEQLVRKSPGVRRRKERDEKDSEK